MIRQWIGQVLLAGRMQDFCAAPPGSSTDWGGGEVYVLYFTFIKNKTCTYTTCTICLLLFRPQNTIFVPI